MQITANFDSSVSSAPAAYKAAVATAISEVQSLFTNAVNLTIDFGWGEQDGQAVTGASSSTAPGTLVDYATLKGALKASATDYAGYTAANSLPDADPSGGGSYYVTSAQAKAIGLGSSAPVDGYVGLNAGVNWSTAADGSVAAGQHDMVGALVHEITSVMGRESLTGGTGNNEYTALDLFRYDPSNVTGVVVKKMAHDMSSGSAVFSLDGSKVSQTFADPSTGALGQDWSSATQADDFASSYAGVKQSITGTDLQVMSAIGWSPAASAYASVTPDANTGGSANSGVALVPATSFVAAGATTLPASNPASLAPARSSAPAEVSNDAVGVAMGAPTVANGAVTVSGTVMVGSGSANAVELMDGGSAVGSAFIDTDGSYSVTAQVGAGAHSFVVDAMQATNNGGSVGSGDVTGTSAGGTSYDVTTGVQGKGYASEVDQMDASGHVVGQTRYKADGTVFLQSTGDQMANGDTELTSTGGSVFGGVHFSQMHSTYGTDGSLLERDFTGGDGTPSSTAGQPSPGMHDIYTFAQNPGDLTVQDFMAGSANHSVLILSSADFNTVADVLRNTTMSDAGAVIHLTPTDSITLAGVTKAELAHNKGDFAFH